MSLDNLILKALTKNELINKVKSSIENKKNLEFLLDNLDGISWEFDLNADKFTFISLGAKQILGYEIEEWTDMASWVKMIHQDDKDDIPSYCLTQTKGGHDHTMEYRMLKKNGEIIWVVDIIRLGKDENNKVCVLYGFILDITKRKNEQLKIEKEHKFLQTVINGISDPVMIINQDYSVSIMNKAVQKKIQGRQFIEQSSPKCYEISYYRDSPCETINQSCPLKDVLESGEKTKVMYQNKRPDGSDEFLEILASPLFDEHNNCVGIIESARDVTSYIKLTKELENKSNLLKHEATHDYLTGLPNRVLFMDRLEESIKDTKRRKNSLTLFFMDLDYFKEINDTFGHAMGDIVLKDVCLKFLNCTRENDVLSRLAGDEFTLILKDIHKKKDIITVAQKFIDVFKEPLIIDGNKLKLSVSIGISIYSKGLISPEKLLKKADTAMYEAKASGKCKFKFSL